MAQDVLAVAGAELQAPHQPEDLRIEIVQAQLEGRGLAVAADGVFHLRPHLLDDLFDARGMDAAVGDEPLDRAARDLAPVRIEAGEDHRPGRVVDDEVDARRHFERADVAALAADDPALHVVARKVDDRDRGLDRVFGGAALDGLRDDGARALGGLLARLGLEPLHQPGGVAPRVGFELLDQLLARFVGGQARHALEILPQLRGDRLGSRGCGGHGLLARGQCVLSPDAGPRSRSSSPCCCSMAAASRLASSSSMPAICWR